MTGLVKVYGILNALWYVIKETLLVLYWIGMWYVIIPPTNENEKTAYTCLFIGGIGIFLARTTDNMYVAGYRIST